MVINVLGVILKFKNRFCFCQSAGFNMSTGEVIQNVALGPVANGCMVINVSVWESVTTAIAKQHVYFKRHDFSFGQSIDNHHQNGDDLVFSGIAFKRCGVKDIEFHVHIFTEDKTSLVLLS